MDKLTEPWPVLEHFSNSLTIIGEKTRFNRGRSNIKPRPLDAQLKTFGKVKKGKRELMFIRTNGDTLSEW